MAKNMFGDGWSLESIKDQSMAEASAFSGPSASYLQNFDPKTIMKDPAFLQDVAEVYASQGKYFSNTNDLIDTFFADKTWREFNSVSLAKSYVNSATASDPIKEKMARIQEVYDRFPNFWEEGGRSAFDALSDAVPAAILDPLNLIPIGKAAQVGRQAAKLGKSAFLAGAKDGAVKLAAAEGAIAGGFATVDEFDRVETGQQDEISGGRIALEAILGGTLGGVLGGAIGGIAAKISNTQVTQIVARKTFLEEQIPNLDGQELNDAVAEIGQINRILDEVPDADQNIIPLADQSAEPEAPSAQMADEVAPEPEVVDPAEEINSAISNLDRLEADVVQELEQVESQMGLRPGAIAMPGQMAAYQNDPSRFNQELFERAQELLNLQDQIGVQKISQNQPEALRQAAQRAADKGDQKKAALLLRAANQASSRRTFFATAENLDDLRDRVRTDFIVDPEDNVTDLTAPPRRPEPEVVRQEQAPDPNPDNLPEPGPRAPAGMVNFDVNRPDVVPLGGKLPEVEADPIAEVETPEASGPDGAPDGTPPAPESPPDAPAPDGETSAAPVEPDAPDETFYNDELEPLVTYDPKASGEQKETRPMNSVVFYGLSEVGARAGKLKSAWKLPAKARDILGQMEASPDAYRMLDYNKGLDRFLKQAFPGDSDIDISPIKTPLKNEKDFERVTRRQIFAVMTDPLIKKRLNDDELLVIFKTAKGEYQAGKIKTPEGLPARGAVDEAPTQAAEPETATAAPDAETNIAPGTANLVMNNPNFVNRPAPVSERQPVAEFADPGQPPEGMTIAIIAPGEKPRKLTYRQRQRLADGDLSTADAPYELMGTTKERQWEVVFVPLNAQQSAANFMDLIVRPGAVPTNRTYDFDINVRDEIPQWSEIVGDSIGIPKNFRSAGDLKGARNILPPPGGGGTNALQLKNRAMMLEYRVALRANKKDMQAVFDELEDIYTLIPEYRHNELDKAQAIDALVGENGIFRKAKPEVIATFRDVLRRFSNKAGVLPTIKKTFSATFRPQDSSVTIRAGSGADDLGHELFHWLYANILSPAEKKELNDIVLNNIYDGSGKLDMDKLQEMSPLPLKDRKGDRIAGNPYSISANNVQEILANQFNIYMNQTMPQQASVFQKITEFVQAIIDRFLDGRRLSPELSRRFDILLPQTAQDLLKGTGDAVTNTGAVIRDAVDELQAMRIDLEKAMAFPGGIGKARLQEHLKKIGMISSEAELKEALPGGLVPFLDKAFNKNYSFDKFSETDLLNAANKLVDAHDEMDGALKQAFKDAENQALAPANPMAELPVQIPDSRDMGPLGIQAQLKQIEVEEIKKGFREEFEAAYATGVRAEVEAVFEKYAGRFTYLANTRMFNKSIVLQTGNGDGYGSKARPRMKQYLDEVKNQLYGAARNPKAQLREKFEKMPDDEFMKFANLYYGIAQTRLDRVMNIYINAAKKSKAQMVKAHNEAVSNVQAKINTAKATAANRRQAVDSVVSADAPLRTLSTEKINAELRVSATDKRAADLYSEIERRKATEIPVDVEPAQVSSRKLASLIRQEDTEFRGVQIDDGIPNDAPAMVREAIRKITHRDPTTQRMARGIMHRLINLADGDQLRLLNIADQNTDITYTGDAFNNLRNEIRQLSRSIGGTGKNKVLNTASASRKIAELTMRAAPPDADSYAIIEGAYEAAGDSFKQGRTPAQWFSKHLARAINVPGESRPFGSTPANDMLESALESAAYLTNGFIRKPSMRNRMEPLLAYGDMFEGIPSQTSPSRIMKERVFIEGGLGATESGSPIPYYHAVARTSDVASREYTAPVTRASENPSFGPGVYVTQSRQSLIDGPADVPTPQILGRMIDERVDPGQQEVAEGLSYALSTVRMQIDDLTRQMSKVMDDGKNIYADEMANLRLTEEALAEELADLGVDAMPGVAENRVRAVSSIDLRPEIKYTIFHPDMRNMMDAVIDRGLVPQDRVEAIAVTLGNAEEGFDGTALYKNLTAEIVDAQNLSEASAKAELNAALSDLGYDSMRIREQSVTADGQPNEYESLVVFNSSNVSSPDSQRFSPENEFFRTESVSPEPTAPVGSLALAMADTGGVPDVNKMGAIIGEMEKSGLAKGAQIIMKFMRRQPLTQAERDILHTANPFKYLMNNANRLRHRHMHWLAKFTKPLEGAGFHEKEANGMATKVLPLLNAIREITGETPFTRWKDTVLSDPRKKRVKQHASAAAVVKALRRGERYANENLTPEQLSLFHKIRAGFDKELQAMSDLGMGVGRIVNYFPQVYDIETIQTNQDEFVALIAEMIKRDRVANPMSSGSAPADPNEIARQIMFRIIDEEGVYVPENKLRATRNGKNPHTDYARVLNLSAINEFGDLRYGDILQELEDKNFLVNNLDGIVSKYYQGTTKKILLQEKFGTGNHGYHDYMVVRGGGARAAIELLSDNRVTPRAKLQKSDFNSVMGDEVRVNDIKGFSEDEAERLVDAITVGIASDSMTVPTIEKFLRMAKPNATQADLRRFEAVANALYEHEKFGAIKQSAGDFSDAYFAVVQGRSLEQSQRSRLARQASKAIRNFNSVTLLSYTALTSITDLALPFLRGARMRDSLNMIRQSFIGDNGPEYRAAIANIGAAMESQVHARMSMLYGSAGGKLTNQFFAANGLAPWTNLQRNIATATGYELLKAQQKIAVKNFNPNAKSQNRAFRTAKRMLSEFGLGEYVNNGRTLDDLSLLDAVDGDQKVRLALHRFSNETIFQPTVSDNPLWAQGPVGAVVFQLKSYPLMFQRLIGKIYDETSKGNFVPMTNLLILGSGAGAGTLAIKDVAQARGGDDDMSWALRERSFTDMAEKMGYNPRIHGPVDEFLGWVAQAHLHLGGFGLLGDIFFNMAAQVDNGLYGATRITSTLLGPTSGAFLDTVQFGQGMIDQALDLSPESNAKERAAWRFAGSRIPFLGGNRAFREYFAELLGGEDVEDKAESYSANYGNNYGGGYSTKY